MHTELFVLGPTEIEDDVRDAGSRPMRYARTPEYTVFLKGIFSKLQKLFCTKDPVYVIACSGTGAMEFALQNMNPGTETVGYVDGGNFGARWGEIARHLGYFTECLKVKHGEALRPKALEDFLNDNPDVRVMCFTHNETSTGVLTDIKLMTQICHNHDVFVICDAVSSLGVNYLMKDEMNIDVLLTSSQKALAIPPGLGFVSMSEAARKFGAARAKNKSFYFDVELYHKDWLRGQTPFTPAGSLLEQLDLRLDKMLSKPLGETIQHYEDLTNVLRMGIKLIGLEIFGEEGHLSNCVTTVKAPEGVDALDIVNHLKTQYGTQMAPCAGDDAHKYFRVGNFGNVHLYMIMHFIENLKRTIEEVKAIDYTIQN